MTRDVREGVAKLGDMRFRVMDTAGLETSAETESVLARTAGITAAVLRDCQIALFLIDGRFLFLTLSSSKSLLFPNDSHCETSFVETSNWERNASCMQTVHDIGFLSYSLILQIFPSFK